MVEYQLPWAGRRPKVGTELECQEQSTTELGGMRADDASSMGSGAISFLKAVVGTLVSFLF